MFRKGLGEKNEFSSYHPLVNLVYFIFIIGITMFSVNPVFLAMTFAASWAYSILLKGVKAIKFNCLFLIPIIIITTVINPLFSHNGVTILFYLNENPITKEAIVYGFASAILLTSIIIWFSTVNVIIREDKFIYLFGRLIPVIALTISMCMRFVPLLKNRFKEITEGQKCMGRDFSSGSIMRRLRQFFKEVSILIAWSLETSIETADSMEARGYGLKGRTSFHLYKFDRRDFTVLTAMVILGAVVAVGCFMGKTDIYYYPAIYFPETDVFTVVIEVFYFMLLIMPMIIDIRGERRWRQYSLEM